MEDPLIDLMREMMGAGMSEEEIAQEAEILAQHCYGDYDDEYDEDYDYDEDDGDYDDEFDDDDNYNAFCEHYDDDEDFNDVWEPDDMPKIYISGISGTGMGPLALMARDAGCEVCGSDLVKGAIYDELEMAGIDVEIGDQDGEYLAEKIENGEVDWFVYTSALPEDHEELEMAKEAGLKISKRDELTMYLVRKLGLRMVAVAGTHGKTTTAAMIVWAARFFGLPVSHVVGTTLDFAPSGAYDRDDRFFVYEADEYDRNFLRFHPWLSVITTIAYDHPDVYPTWEDYVEAFTQFKNQSYRVLESQDDTDPIEMFKMAGKARREDARLAMGAVLMMLRDTLAADVMAGREPQMVPNFIEIQERLEDFPGVGRRFEQLEEGIYTDYAHHPDEVAATMNIALEECKLKGYEGVAVIYEPHQNARQHAVRRGYRNAFKGAEQVYWLPTYLTREPEGLKVLKPRDLIKGLKNADVAVPTELTDEFFNELMNWHSAGYMIVLMTAGPADAWLREKLEEYHEEELEWREERWRALEAEDDEGPVLDLEG